MLHISTQNFPYLQESKISCLEWPICQQIERLGYIRPRTGNGQYLTARHDTLWLWTKLHNLQLLECSSFKLHKHLWQYRRQHHSQKHWKRCRTRSRTGLLRTIISGNWTSYQESHSVHQDQSWARRLSASILHDSRRRAGLLRQWKEASRCRHLQFLGWFELWWGGSTI